MIGKSTQVYNSAHGFGGPSQSGISPEIDAAGLSGDHFGVIASTTVPVRRGTWKVSTLSDDGIRVTVDGKRVIDNWTWHGPTRDAGTFELKRDRAVEIKVEHFEIDGYATLVFELESAGS